MIHCNSSKIDILFLANFRRFSNRKSSFRAGSEKIYRFVYKIRESLTVPKQELAYNSKSSNKAQKLPTYSDQSVGKKKHVLKTLICIEHIGKNAV